MAVDIFQIFCGNMIFKQPCSYQVLLVLHGNMIKSAYYQAMLSGNTTNFGDFYSDLMIDQKIDWQHHHETHKYWAVLMAVLENIL